jgi:N-methylhydantoinase A
MANAGRVHAVENGRDLATFTMIAFGGAGPIHAARLCAKMGLRRFLVPAGAGVGSAIGFLRAPFSYEAVRSAPIRLERFDAETVNRIISALTTEAGDFVRAVMPELDPVVTLTAYMRYVGQGWEIPVQLPGRPFEPGDGDTLAGLFAEAYVRIFGRTVAGLAVEAVSWSTKVSAPAPPTAVVPAVVQVSSPAPSGRRLVFDGAAYDFVDAAVHGRANLRPGDTIEGPAIIVESQTSTLVPTTFAATVLADGCLLVAQA